jgi:cytochrome c556
MESPLKAHSPKNALILIAVCAGLSCTVAAAVAQPQGADAVKPRQTNFKAMGKDFKAIGDQLKSDAPDFGVIKSAAAEVKTYSTALPSWFPKGSGPETGLKMRAKAAIWTDPKDFAAITHNYQVEAAKLAALTATSTDVAALRAQFKATGQTCGACHDKYREKE